MDDCRLRSRRRAARALAEKRRRGTTGVSCDEESPTRERAKPPRRKKKEPIYEEDVIDGFAILSFKNYEDIEVRFYCSWKLDIIIKIYGRVHYMLGVGPQRNCPTRRELNSHLSAFNPDQAPPY
ncbi:uncharacterized protein [Halyomorpha halys]|uniref:uncharacterized protein n=1 Tax=Halyomorpha halys TaxID=286706 RepID=UPI0034D1FA05